jgi:hypothetical protein
MWLSFMVLWIERFINDLIYYNLKPKPKIRYKKKQQYKHGGKTNEQKVLKTQTFSKNGWTVFDNEWKYYLPVPPLFC